VSGARRRSGAGRTARRKRVGESCPRVADPVMETAARTRKFGNGSRMSPSGFAAKRAGVRESKFGEMQGAKECGFLSGIGKHAGRKPVIDSFAGGVRTLPNLLPAEPQVSASAVRQSSWMRLCVAGN